MKTAKEMFEELGYMCIDEEDDFSIDYHITCQCEVTKDYYNQDIIFDLLDKEIKLATDVNYVVRLSAKELQAINKQVEELGWLDEV